MAGGDGAPPLRVFLSLHRSDKFFCRGGLTELTTPVKYSEYMQNGPIFMEIVYFVTSYIRYRLAGVMA